MTRDDAYWARVRAAAAALQSDGCTGVADIHLDCCHEHDIAYSTGRTVEGTPITKYDADAMFRRCIQARSPYGRYSPLSWWRWLGVTWFGRGVFGRRPPRQEWPT